MIGSTDRHIETARAVRDQICLESECKFDAGCGCLEAISSALAAAEREGMKRAVEILTEYAAENGPVNEFDDDGYWREVTALTVAAAILSEAGED